MFCLCFHPQAVENAIEDKKKAKIEKVKKCIRTAAGTSWEDPSLLDWDSGTNGCMEQMTVSKTSL